MTGSGIGVSSNGQTHMPSWCNGCTSRYERFSDGSNPSEGTTQFFENFDTDRTDGQVMLREPFHSITKPFAPDRAALIRRLSRYADLTSGILAERLCHGTNESVHRGSTPWSSTNQQSMIHETLFT